MSDLRPIQDHAWESMDEAQSLLLEDRLWWVQGRKAIIRTYLQLAAQAGPIRSIMDVGCGTGGNLGVLAEFGQVAGVEISAPLAARAKSRGVAQAIYQQDARELEACRTVDLFTLFDVLEHIEADGEFLDQLRRRAGSWHRLLVSVPACPFLYGDHDRLLHHYRRYNGRRLRAALEQGGYRVLHMNHFMFFLFPMAFLARMKDLALARWGRQRAGVELGDLPPWLAAPFAASLRAEARLARRVRFPFGLWLFALAESATPTPPAPR